MLELTSTVDWTLEMGRDSASHMNMANGERLCISGDDETGSYLRLGRVGSIRTRSYLQWGSRRYNPTSSKLTWILQNMKRALNSSGGRRRCPSALQVQ